MAMENADRYHSQQPLAVPESKHIFLVIAGAGENYRSMEIVHGTTTLDILTALNLNWFELLKPSEGSYVCRSSVEVSSSSEFSSAV